MEQEFVNWLRGQVAAHPQLRVGPGDDAAVLDLQKGSQLVVTSDLLTDQVDFVLGDCSAEQVGRKALAVNLSDLAAMAARPLAVIVSVALPARDAAPLARAMYRGLLDLATEHNVAVAGGDTNTWDGPLVISVTALGETTARGPLLRSGARPGDLLLATGAFGGSILGHHFHFTPRVQEALRLHERYELHAGIDVSDGLSLDLSRLATESNCGAELELHQVPIRPAAHQLAAQDPAGRSALQHALEDGEDFELLLAVPADEAQRMLVEQPLDVPLTCLGRFIDQPGLWARDARQTRRPLTPGGWLH